MYKLVTLRNIHSALVTRDFTPASFKEEISSNLNGNLRFARTPTTLDLSTQHIINIHVSAKALTKERTFSKYDPVCMMSVFNGKRWVEYARTEVCWNILNPIWVTPFTYNAITEHTKLKFEIFDIHNSSNSLMDHELLCFAEMELDELLDSPTHNVKLELTSVQSNKPKGILDLNYFELAETQGSVLFKFNIPRMRPAKKNIFRKPNPFFILSRYSSFSDEFIPVYKSSVLKGHKIDWNNVELFLQFVCGGDLANPLRILIFDYTKKKNHNYLGHFDTSIGALINEGQSVFELYNEKKHFLMCSLNVEYVQHIQTPRLFDYRLKGIQIAPFLALDFSCSNRDFTASNRVLHYESGAFSYQLCINDVCDILRPLVMGLPYHVYGFADFEKPPMKFKTLALKNNKELIPNAVSVIQSYLRFRAKAKFPKKCFLAPMIVKAREVARQNWSQNKAVTLMTIITNGVFDDLELAINEIVASDNDPLCIVIIAMGPAPRDLIMKFKHNHGILTSVLGNRSTRRIVKLTTYLEWHVFPDPYLPITMQATAKKLIRTYLEKINYQITQPAS